MEEVNVNAPGKRRAKGWEEREECFLIDEVLRKESILFGDAKGCGAKGVNRMRAESWQNIADCLNARFSNAKREAPEVKKKFFNLKQRTKGKIDVIRKAQRQTGGGPPHPALTPAEELLSQTHGGRPGVHGLSQGIDTDEITDSCTMAEQSEPVPGPSHPEIQLMGKAKKNTRDKGKRKLEEEEILENTRQDTKRILLEQKKLELEIEFLEKRNHLVYLKSLYYQMKLNSEFGITSDVHVLQNES